ncbi:LLM class flavin-dependent oxidoreductase [Nonomuraea sp. NPDC050022]|uniref:LLM class flavin-dependent oxidoreductase n=1 Tax=unclassified Nonomuraea TaxID=2593643 RepID=UPI00340AFE5F
MYGPGLIFGLGAGYLEPELRALGVPMSDRGSRLEEYLAAIRSLWQDEKPAFDGRHVSFKDVDAPRPLPRPVPVVIGGHTLAAHRLDAATVRSYAELGMDRLIVATPPGLSLSELDSFIKRNAPAELLK